MYSCGGILVIRTICLYIGGAAAGAPSTLAILLLSLTLMLSKDRRELHGQEVQGLKVHLPRFLSHL